MPHVRFCGVRFLFVSPFRFLLFCVHKNKWQQLVTQCINGCYTFPELFVGVTIGAGKNGPCPATFVFDLGRWRFLFSEGTKPWSNVGTVSGRGGGGAKGDRPV